MNSIILYLSLCLLLSCRNKYLKARKGFILLQAIYRMQRHRRAFLKVSYSVLKILHQKSKYFIICIFEFCIGGASNFSVEMHTVYTFSHSSDSGNTHVLVINILCMQYIFSLKTKKYWTLHELQ